MPCIVDTATGLVVTNNYPQITLDLSTQWTELHGSGAPQLYPEAERPEMDELIQQIGGLLVAWAASVSRSVAFIVDALLDQPDALRHAHDVAVAVAAELDAKPENPDTTIEPMWQVPAEAKM